jgi:hypothetical protein
LLILERLLKFYTQKPKSYDLVHLSAWLCIDAGFFDRNVLRTGTQSLPETGKSANYARRQYFFCGWLD